MSACARRSRRSFARRAMPRLLPPCGHSRPRSSRTRGQRRTRIGPVASGSDSLARRYRVSYGSRSSARCLRCGSGRTVAVAPVPLRQRCRVPRRPWATAGGASRDAAARRCFAPRRRPGASSPRRGAARVQEPVPAHRTRRHRHWCRGRGWPAAPPGERRARRASGRATTTGGAPRACLGGGRCATSGPAARRIETFRSDSATQTSSLWDLYCPQWGSLKRKAPTDHWSRRRPPVARQGTALDTPPHVDKASLETRYRQSFEGILGSGVVGGSKSTLKRASPAAPPDSPK